MSVTCRELAERLIDFLGAELPPEYHRELERHLCDCPPCEAYFETYRLTVEWSKRLPPRPLPDAFARRLVEALRHHAAEAGRQG